MKRLFWLLLLAGPYVYAESSSISPPPVKETEKPVDLEREIRRLSESLLPSAGGDKLFYRDNKNQRIGIGTTEPTCKLDVDGEICATSFNGITVSSAVYISSGIAFSVYQSTNLIAANNALTQITFNTEEFDTANNFASSTYTPTTAGYYQLNGCATIDAPGATGSFYVSLLKNFSEYKRGDQVSLEGSLDESSCFSVVVNANGTDKFTMAYFQLTGGSEIIEGGQFQVYFNGARFP